MRHGQMFLERLTPERWTRSLDVNPSPCLRHGAAAKLRRQERAEAAVERGQLSIAACSMRSFAFTY